MAPRVLFLYTILTFSFSFHGISAAPMNYIVTNEAANTPGGTIFTKYLGIPFTKDVMAKASDFIVSTLFKQTTPADRKPLDSIEVIIKDFREAVAITWGNNRINVSASHIESITKEVKQDLKQEFTSIMYHEMTHVFQWNGEGKCPVGLKEGIADFARLKANVYPRIPAKPGDGDQWDKGYAITARFLEYCEGLVPDFVAKINKMMRTTYDVSFFQKLTGKPVDQLWKDYKAKYAGKKG